MAKKKTHSSNIEAFLDICAELNSESDEEKMLSKLLDRAMEFGNCDTGMLMLLEEGSLDFSRIVVKSAGIRQGGYADPITAPPVAMSERYSAAWTLLHNETINIQNLKKVRDYSFDGDFKYEKILDFRTQSMLVVPMRNQNGAVIGVIQLINAMDDRGKIIPFNDEQEPYITAIAAQASVSITNMMTMRKNDEFVSTLASSIAVSIDMRSQYYYDHTKNMARYARNFLEWLDKSHNPWYFSEDKKKAFLMAVWLHNIGEVTIPAPIFDKNTRLGDENLAAIEERFKHIRLLNKIGVLEGRVDQYDADRVDQRLDTSIKFIRMTNKDNRNIDSLTVARITEIGGYTYTEEDGTETPWLTAEEIECLSIKKGTLTAAERELVQSHVVATEEILSRVKFPKEYARVAQWAGMHHELLNGRGYPNKLEAGHIPREAQLIAILEIFETLTATRRPYKDRGMSAEDAVGMIHNMAYQDNSIDKHVLLLFEHSKAWDDRRFNK